MFRRSKSADLVSSNLYDEHGFFSAFSKDFKRAKKTVIIESPFITNRRASELAPLCSKLHRKGVKVSILTRNPNHHGDELRIQACIGIKKLKESGANVKTYNDLRHRKLAIIDGEILWEGSLNLLSHSNTRELMRRTKSASLCSQLLCFTGINKDLKWYNR